MKNTREYILYWDSMEYKLDVHIENGNVFVDIFDASEVNENSVHGQSPALILVVFLAPEALTAIETCVVATVSAVAAVGAGLGVGYLSTEFIGQVATNSSSTTTRTSPKVRASKKENAAALGVAIGVGTKEEYEQAYYEAAIQDDDTIFIGRLLTYDEALIQLRSGYDIFATDEAKARALARAASPIGLEKGPEIHEGEGDRYHHFHPRGIKWYANARHMPHVWYF